FPRHLPSSSSTTFVAVSLAPPTSNLVPVTSCHHLHNRDSTSLPISRQSLSIFRPPRVSPSAVVSIMAMTFVFSKHHVSHLLFLESPPPIFTRTHGNSTNHHHSLHRELHFETSMATTCKPETQ
ncbi:hypothetical protein V8G54_017610, partial [Vigna mungo]